MGIERVPTGIPNLDELIEGGIPLRSAVMVSGGPGTGKTLLGCQYVNHGLENGENAVFITLEESAEDIRDDAAMFNWDFEQYEEDGQLELIKLNPFKDGSQFSDRIKQTVEDMDARRVVIDSLSVMGIHLQNEGKVRESIYDLIRRLKELDVAVIMTTEIPSGEENKLSRYGVEEFVADGVILLTGVLYGADSYRTLQVVKMRKTDINTDVMTLNITDNGIALAPSAV